MQILPRGGLTLDELRAKYIKTEEQETTWMAEQHKNALQAIASIFEQTPALSDLKLIGYTPDFNDGDPCVHNQKPVILNGFDEWNNEEGDPESQLPKNISRPIKVLLNSIDKLFNIAFGTNWELHAWRDADTLKWDIEDYDCGW